MQVCSHWPSHQSSIVFYKELRWPGEHRGRSAPSSGFSSGQPQARALLHLNQGQNQGFNGLLDLSSCFSLVCSNMNANFHVYVGWHGRWLQWCHERHGPFRCVHALPGRHLVTRGVWQGWWIGSGGSSRVMSMMSLANRTNDTLQDMPTLQEGRLSRQQTAPPTACLPERSVMPGLAVLHSPFHRSRSFLDAGRSVHGNVVLRVKGTFMESGAEWHSLMAMCHEIWMGLIPCPWRIWRIIGHVIDTSYKFEMANGI